MRNHVANHWGLGRARIEGGRLVDVVPPAGDPDPSPINGNIAGSLSGSARVLRPAVRLGWLQGGAGPARGRRGQDPFVELDWPQALDLLAAELTRVRVRHGNEAIFAGSYGWGSAGRLHHPQSQLKRFLNTIGGFVRSEGNYSYNAALVLMPHIVGNYRDHVKEATRLARSPAMAGWWWPLAACPSATPRCRMAGLAAMTFPRRCATAPGPGCDLSTFHRCGAISRPN